MHCLQLSPSWNTEAPFPRSQTFRILVESWEVKWEWLWWGLFCQGFVWTNSSIGTERWFTDTGVDAGLLLWLAHCAKEQIDKWDFSYSEKFPNETACGSLSFRFPLYGTLLCLYGCIKTAGAGSVSGKKLPCCLPSDFHGIGTEWYILWHSLKPRHIMWEAFTHPW